MVRITFFISFILWSALDSSGQTGIIRRAANDELTNPLFSLAPAPLCTDGEVHDDGTFEFGTGGNAAVLTEYRVVERFTPPQYPYDYLQFCVALTRPEDKAIDQNIEMVVYDDDGFSGGPGTLLASIPVVAMNVPTILPGTFYTYDVSGQVPTIYEGNVYIGVKINLSATNSIFVSVDASLTTPRQSIYFYLSSFGTWISNLSTSVDRANSIRASGQVVPGVASVPTLSQWSVLILSLVLGIVGLVRLRQRNVVNPR